MLIESICNTDNLNQFTFTSYPCHQIFEIGHDIHFFITWSNRGETCFEIQKYMAGSAPSNDVMLGIASRWWLNSSYILYIWCRNAIRFYKYNYNLIPFLRFLPSFQWPQIALSHSHTFVTTVTSLFETWNCCPINHNW